MPIFDNFSIDNEQMRPPNEIVELETSDQFVELMNMDDGSTRAYKSVAGFKWGYTISWGWITQQEFKLLLNYINNGFYQVTHQSTEYEIDDEFWISSSNFGFDFGGGRKGVTINLTQQQAPNFDRL